MATYWEIAAHTAYDMFHEVSIKNKQLNYFTNLYFFHINPFIVSKVMGLFY